MMIRILQTTFLLSIWILPNVSFTQEPDKAQYFIHLAKSYRTTHPDSCIQYVEKAINISSGGSHQIVLTDAYLLLAEYFWKKTEYKKALEYAELAKNISLQIGDDRKYAQAILITGNTYIEMGDYDQKIDLFFDALNIFIQLNDEEGKSDAYTSIGSIYYEQQNLEKALEYGLKSLASSKKANDLDGISRALNNIGVLYGDFLNFEKEKSFYLKSIQIAQKMNDELKVGIIYLNLSKVYGNLNDMDSSFYYIYLAHDIFKSINNNNSLANSHILFAHNYLKIREYNQGLKSAHTALRLGQIQQSNKVICESYGILYELYDSIGDLENAYKYLQMHQSIKNSLAMEASRKQLTQIEMKYEFERTLSEKESEQKQKKFIYIMVFTIIIALMIIAIIWLYFRNKIRVTRSIQEKIKLESELETRHKELVTKTMSILKTNKTLTDITNHLNEALKYNTLEESKLAIHTIANTVKQSTKSNVWKEFEIRFQQVHNKFNDHLLAQFPNLTPFDLRLCALLRFNLTTKEISELTGQRTSSLEIARSRLRKKLGITDRSINLVVFLSAF